MCKREVLDAQGDLSYKYTYDAFYQLRSETGAASHTYQHDSLYNRVTKDDHLHNHNALNQLLAHTDCQYRYDANGNLIEKIQGSHSTTYSYDALDRLIEVQDGTNTTSYAYDSFHRRLSKTHNGKIIHYLYQGENEIGAIENGEIKELRVFGLGLGAEIGAAIALEFDGKTYAPIHDPYGNIIPLWILREITQKAIAMEPLEKSKLSIKPLIIPGDIPANGLTQKPALSILAAAIIPLR